MAISNLTSCYDYRLFKTKFCFEKYLVNVPAKFRKYLVNLELEIVCYQSKLDVGGEYQEGNENLIYVI